MKLFTIDFNEEEKLYIQLYNKIKNDILTSKLKPNEKLPSKRELHNYLGISINTIMQAYDLLIEEGFIISIDKKGYYVADYDIKIEKKIDTFELNEKETTNYKYDFTTNNIDRSIFPTYTFSKITKDALFDNSLQVKTNHNGLVNLRKTISKYLYETKGLNINYHNIIIGSGIEYLLSLLALILPCKKYAIENPGYDKLRTILINNNKDITYCNIDNDGIVLPNEWDCIYTTPANQFPTGVKMSLNRKLEIVKNSKNKYIIEDDFDSEFKYLSNISTSLYALSPNNTIMLKTFSRTISPSLRLSYMILPDELLKIYNNKFSTYSSTVSTYDQLIVDRFIKDGYYSRHLNKTKNLYLEKREMIIEILKDNKNIEIEYDRSYLSLIIKVNNLNKDKFKKLCKENSILISLMDNFYFTDFTSNKIIIGYSSIDKALIKSGINLLNNIINESIKKG